MIKLININFTKLFNLNIIKAFMKTVRGVLKVIDRV